MAQGVAHVVRKRLRTLAPAQDFEQMAAIGLLKAIREYDPSRGVPFERFAGVAIARSIYNQLRDNRSLGRRGCDDWGVVLVPLSENPALAYLPRILDGQIARSVFDRARKLDLTWREQVVLEELLGGNSQRDIAARLGVNETRVSQIRTALITKIRADLRSGPSRKAA